MISTTVSMHMGRGRRLTLLLLAVLSGTILADTVEMRDGTLVQGTFLGGTQGTVRFQTKTEIKVIPVTDILALTFDRTAVAAKTAAAAAATTPAAPATTATTPPPAATVTPATAATTAAAKPAVPPVAPTPAKPSLAAGNKVRVRIHERVDSSEHRAGQVFTGELTEELRAGEVVLAPVGAAVAGQLAAGVGDQPALQLVLTGISVNGQVKPVATDDVIAIAAPMTTRNLQSVGIGVALGVLTGGSEGAVKGAGAGTLSAVAVKGDRISVPVNAVLEFQLKTAFVP